MIWQTVNKPPVRVDLLKVLDEEKCEIRLPDRAVTTVPLTELRNPETHIDRAATDIKSIGEVASRAVADTALVRGYSLDDGTAPQARDSGE